MAHNYNYIVTAQAAMSVRLCETVRVLASYFSSTEEFPPYVLTPCNKKVR
jgi:hypothetical protein